MSVYAVGDIQGCLQPLQRLLDKVKFDPGSDQLWLCGDLVNRGPDSLGVLRFVRSLGSAALPVLGNHDLHLLAVAWGAHPLRSKDTFNDVLTADDRPVLLDWVRHWPLIHQDLARGFSMVHAGVPPQWTLPTALERAHEVEQALRGATPDLLLSQMYGDEPAVWTDDLVAGPRLRLITNYLTRMRFCSAAGAIDLHSKEGPETAPPGMAPWYQHPNRLTRADRLIFGHWATLNGAANTPNVYALDTGCVYGGQLTALELTSEQRRCVDCERYDPPGHPWQ